jgi:hypothetical protein
LALDNQSIEGCILGVFARLVSALDLDARYGHAIASILRSVFARLVSTLDLDRLWIEGNVRCAIAFSFGISLSHFLLRTFSFPLSPSRTAERANTAAER